METIDVDEYARSLVRQLDDIQRETKERYDREDERHKQRVRDIWDENYNKSAPLRRELDEIIKRKAEIAAMTAPPQIVIVKDETDKLYPPSLPTDRRS